VFILQALADRSEPGQAPFFIFLEYVFFLTCYFRGSLQRENKQQGGWEPPGQLGSRVPSSRGASVPPGGQCRAGRAAELSVVMLESEKDGSPFQVGMARRDRAGSEVAGLRPRGCHRYRSPVEGDNPREGAVPAAAEDACGYPTLSPTFPPFVSSLA